MQKTAVGISLALSIAALAVVGRSAGQEGEKSTVRPLKFAPRDPALIFRIGGQSKLHTFGDPAALDKFLGKAAAEALARQVDFAQEQIVLVSWTTSGPPEGVLRYEATGKGKGITFFVQGPPPGRPRGMRARIGADFFAVPKTAQVHFDPKER